MFEIVVGGEFVASHQLKFSDGRVEPRHEHVWRVRVLIAGDDLNSDGVLVDFAAVRQALAAVTDPLAGRDLNDTPPFERKNPSAENVAMHIGGELAESFPDGLLLTYVEVEEEPGCFARYYLY